MRADHAHDLRDLLVPGRVVHAPGVVDPLSAKIAVASGAEVLYLSGAAASAVVQGEPDLGFVNGTEIAELGHRIVRATGRPLVADADTGYGNAVHVGRTVRRYVAAGIAGLHLEDQVQPKRCGHLAGKQVVPIAEAVQKVVAAVEAASGDAVVIARTDAWSVEGPESAVERAAAYARAGADLVFVEGVRGPEDLQRVRAGVAPGTGLVLNRSEAAGTMQPLDDERLRDCDVRLVIHPVSALLASARAMAEVYEQVTATGRTDRPRMPWPDLNRLLGLDGVLDEEARHAAAEASASQGRTAPGVSR